MRIKLFPQPSTSSCKSGYETSGSTKSSEKAGTSTEESRSFEDPEECTKFSTSRTVQGCRKQDECRHNECNQRSTDGSRSRRGEKLQRLTPTPFKIGNVRTNCVNLTSKSSSNSMSRYNKVYHEKQMKSLCALHALNNLFQDSNAFTQLDLDSICAELAPNSWVNPHKSVLGFGNYDINVIMTALQRKNYDAIWFDKRKDPSELNCNEVFGFIMNVPSDCKFGWLALPIKRKHWIAIRNLPSSIERDSKRNHYYNLDSKFDSPESIGGEDSLISFLRTELKSNEKELFVVVTNEVSRFECWKKDKASSSAGCAKSFSSVRNDSLTPPDVGLSDHRKISNDSGVVELLACDLKDINVVDLDKDEILRRQSSGVWSDH